MKKIVFIINELNFAGAQIMLFELLKQIHNSYNIRLVVKNTKQGNSLENDIENFKNVEVVYIGEKNNDNKIKKIKNFLLFKKEIDKFSPDIIHCHLVETYAFLYSLISKKKIIFTIHSWPDRILYKKKNEKIIRKLINKKLIYFVGCAKCVSDRFKQIINNRVDYKYIETIYNPLCFDNFNDFKNKPKQKNSLFTFINVGRLSPVKNQALLINAFSKMKNINKCELKIVGNGELESNLKKLVIDLKLTKRIKFISNLSNTEVHKKIFDSDCFVLTSRSECCPMVILESLILRTPIISTNVGGIGEITNNSCILVENDNIEQLVCSMDEIVENSSLGNKLVADGYKQIKNFDSNLITKLYCNLYDKVLNDE